MRTLSQPVVAVLLLVACQSAAPSKHQGGVGDASGGNGSSTGNVSSGGNVSTTTDAGGAQSALGGAGAESAGGTPPVSLAMSLTSAAARIAGRRGDQLYVTVDGTAEPGTFASIEVTLRSSDGTPLVFFDNDWDGVLESATGRIQPLKKPSSASFTAEAVLNDVAQLVDLNQLEVALFDRTNARTERLSVKVQPQAIVEQGGACEPKYLGNRCREGLSCSGSPAKCVAATAPTMAHAAFQRGTVGPFIRADGLDPDEDVILVRVDFFDSADAPVSIDLDGDEVPDSDHLEVDSGITNQNGGYLFVVESGLGFESLVPRIGLTAIDSKGNTSARQKASISTRQTRVAGQSCDLAGFVGCAAGTVCLPSPSGTASYCSTLTQAQSNACDAAPVWDLASDPPKITGMVAGYSTWEPPTECISATANNRPEAVVKLRLRSAVSKLVLSTAEPETRIDTGIVVLPSCTASTSMALACNDDHVGYTSQVTLTDVAAGDYFVIVESVQSDGGGFALSATVQ